MPNIKKILSIPFILALALIHITVATGDQGTMPTKIALDGFDETTAARVEQFVKRQMALHHSPGIAAGIVKGDKLVFAGYFGYADIDSARPVDEKTIFRIGSISKTMTTVGLMQQWEAGKFKLDDDANKYLPQPYMDPPHPESAPITLRHLLTHTSGGGELLSLRQLTRKWLGLVVEGDDYKPLEYYLDIGMKTKIDPGVKWAYSNFGFGYLGLALETIVGEPFHEYQKKNLFDRLGMKITSYRHNDEILENLVTGYQYEEGEYREAPHKAYGITSAGNVYTNIEEMALYVAAMLNGGAGRHGTVIKPETLSMVMKTHYTLDEKQNGWGLGFGVYGNDMWGHRVVGHSGSVPFGYTSMMLLVPEEKIGVFVFSNSWTYSPKPIGWGILKIVLGVNGEPLPETQPKREIWPDLVGYYGPEHRDLKTDMRLLMKSVGKFRVAVVNDDLVLIHTWKGKDKARKLLQVAQDDPYFFMVADAKSPVPLYARFKKMGNGKMYLVHDGLNEYVKMGPVRKAKTVLAAPIGKHLSKLIP